MKSDMDKLQSSVVGADEVTRGLASARQAACDRGADPVHQVLYDYGVGIDCHSKFIQVCVLYQLGGQVRRAEKEFTTSWDDLVRAKAWAMEVLGPLAKPDVLRYCIESTGAYHMPVLLAWKAIPCVVNPLLAGPTRRKTDVLDARMLAHHSITGIWKPSFIPTESAQVLRVLWAARAEALRAATRASNRINNVVLRFGHTFGATAVMRTAYSEGILSDLIDGQIPDLPGVAPEGLPVEIRTIIAALLLDMTGAVSEGRKATVAAENYIKSRDWPLGEGVTTGTTVLSLLKTVPGVGAATAVTWLAEVTDPRRFSNAKQVAAYAGCDPSLKVSAGKVTSQVRRAGNVRLHQALLHAAGGVLRRPDDKFALWGRSILGRHKKGGFRKACGAIARRIACALWYVHSKGEKFSYEGYTFTRRVYVAVVKVDVILGARAVKVLAKEGITTSQQLADMYYRGKLAGIFGFSEASVQATKAWILLNTKKHSATNENARLYEQREQSGMGTTYQLHPPVSFVARGKGAGGAEGPAGAA